jgi:hypothetical protein
MRRETPRARKKVRDVELSNSRPLSQCTVLMVQPNWVRTWAKKLERAEKVSDFKRSGKVQIK